MSDDWEKVELADQWKPEKEGESITGVLVNKKEHVGDNDSMFYEIELLDGVVMGVWGSTVLDTRLQHLEVGEEVKIIYLGRAESQKRKGASYKNFDVYHRKAPFEKA